MKIGFTGTREGMTDEQKSKVSEILKDFDIEEAHHGDCVGADSDFHEMLDENVIHIHPPKNESKRAFCEGGIVYSGRPYLVRNRDIVNSSDILIATPKDMKEHFRSSGTWATIRFARHRKIPIYIVWPDGTLKVENASQNTEQSDAKV